MAFKRKKFFKKILSSTLTLQLLGLVLSACSNNSSYKILPTYTSQADVLLSLGISPDYYPHQTRVISNQQIASFLTNSNKFLENVPTIFPDSSTKQNKIITERKAIASKISSLISQIGEVGRGWWDEHTTEEEQYDKSNEYWTTKSADLLIYDSLVGDTVNNGFSNASFNSGPSSKFKIKTNYRTPRDPYTIFPKEVYELGLKAKDWKDRINNTKLIDNEANRALEEKAAKEFKELFNKDPVGPFTDYPKATSNNKNSIYTKEYSSTFDATDVNRFMFTALLSQSNLIKSKELNTFLKSENTRIDDLIQKIKNSPFLVGFQNAAESWFENFTTNEEFENDAVKQWILDDQQPVFFPGNTYNDQAIAAMFQRGTLLTNDVAKFFSESLGYNRLNYLNKYAPKVIGGNPECLDKCSPKQNEATEKPAQEKSLASQTSFLKTTQKATKELYHHPIFHQTIPGVSVPNYEGSIHSNLFYSFKIASALEKYTSQQNFKKLFENDKRWTKIGKALKNYYWMSNNFRNRLNNIREYLKAINVVDPNYDPYNGNFDNKNSKKIAIVMVSPDIAEGQKALMGIGQYPELYFDIGLKQLVPDAARKTEPTQKAQTNNKQSVVKELHHGNHNHGGNLSNVTGSATSSTSVPNGFYPNDIKVAGLRDSNEDNPALFNIDYNSWWMNFGSSNKKSKTTNALRFVDKADYTLLGISGGYAYTNPAVLREVMSITNVKNNKKYPDQKNYNTNLKDPEIYGELLNKDSRVVQTTATAIFDYNLMGQGNGSLIGKNMILDQVLNALYNRYHREYLVNLGNEPSEKARLSLLAQKAYDWGSYWNYEFVDKPRPWPITFDDNKPILFKNKK